MTAQGNALGNKSATMTNALKGRNKMFNPPNGGKSFALSGLARFVSYGSQGVALGLHVTAPLGSAEGGFALQADRAPPDVSRNLARPLLIGPAAHCPP